LKVKTEMCSKIEAKIIEQGLDTPNKKFAAKEAKIVQACVESHYPSSTPTVR
jgi:hypothetical protein